MLGAATLAVAGTSPTDTEDEVTEENTHFNQIQVPPMKEFTPDNWDAEVKASKFLMVKHYR